jgi:N-acylneuraminate cytidylyltransferase
MKKLAIIPARGGSKRIPRKNIKDFCGSPIISYSIKVALNSGLFDKVIVSTDDDEIAEVAINLGAEVPFMRSKKNADDYATTFDVIDEVLSSLRETGDVFESACCIYPTAPFVNEAKLKKAFELLENKNFDCVFPVMRYSFPVQRAVKVINDKIEMLQPEHVNTRSQDLDPTFHDAGQFYFFNCESLLKKKKLWTDNTGVIEISEMEGQDIDDQTDWELAELKFEMLNKII